MRAFAALIVLLALSAAAQARTCAELNQDLRSMQKAQSSLLDSMVNKNDSMASTLDQYAENFNSQKAVRTTDVVSLKRSAEAFRSHKAREQKLVSRFQSKTDELLGQIEQCLKAKNIAAK